MRNLILRLLWAIMLSPLTFVDLFTDNPSYIRPPKGRNCSATAWSPASTSLIEEQSTTWCGAVRFTIRLEFEANAELTVVK